ncbi:MAG: elongation factor Ts, partial [Coriobacteriia bacterium]|nr:elongation factor Ts [Coriobacteriia bacterium]
EKFFKEQCLTEQAFVKDSDKTVTEYVNSVAKALGGTIKVKSFTRFALGE